MGEKGEFVDGRQAMLLGIFHDHACGLRTVRMSVTIRIPSGGVLVISENEAAKSSGSRTPSGTDQSCPGAVPATSAAPIAQRHAEVVGVPQHRHVAHARHGLLEESQTLGRKFAGNRPRLR